MSRWCCQSLISAICCWPTARVWNAPTIIIQTLATRLRRPVLAGYARFFCGFWKSGPMSASGSSMCAATQLRRSTLTIVWRSVRNGMAVSICCCGSLKIWMCFTLCRRRVRFTIWLLTAGASAFGLKIRKSGGFSQTRGSGWSSALI